MRSVIIYASALPTGAIDVKLRGNMTPAEIIFALELLKNTILTQQKTAGLPLEGMLRPDLTRVPKSNS